MPKETAKAQTEPVFTLAIIVPLFNEIAVLPSLLAHLRALVSLHSNVITHIIAVDGGSDDGSWRWLEQQWHQPDNGFYALQSTVKGRAQQMNYGASYIDVDTLLFLHADTQLPDSLFEVLLDALRQNRLWGRFDVRFDTADWRMWLIAFFINQRSCLTGIATGDQALFVNTDLFNRTGGYPLIELMEDVALTKQLKRHSKPYCAKPCVTTSARRWLKNGVFRTVLLMWYFRLAYFFGMAPNKLAQQYRDIR